MVSGAGEDGVEHCFEHGCDVVGDAGLEESMGDRCHFGLVKLGE